MLTKKYLKSVFKVIKQNTDDWERFTYHQLRFKIRIINGKCKVVLAKNKKAYENEKQTNRSKQSPVRSEGTKIMEYKVFWEIDVEADSPKEAAQKALEIQRDPESQALVFNVNNDSGKVGEIDLLKERK